ncbi:MAG: hypothetical protein V8S31_03995 [Lachnospiraceae bacterium]
MLGYGKISGDTIHIHAGGEDLSSASMKMIAYQAANGVPFAHYWMDNRFLNINNQKMSKSP